MRGPCPHDGARAVLIMSAGSRTSNNVNLLRLLLAFFVVAYHLIVLAEVAQWRALEVPLAQLAEIGVQGFFVLSGYLVYASLDRSRSIGLYAEKRFRRLYPAYAVVIIACAAAGLALSAEARTNLAGVGEYLGWNLVFANFMAPELPGVFQSNPMHEINGALWTLKIEVMFYLVLPILAWLLRVAGPARWLVIVLVYVGAEAWRIVLSGMGQAELARQLPGQMSFFITGMALFLLPLPLPRLHIAGLAGRVASLGYRRATPRYWPRSCRRLDRHWLAAPARRRPLRRSLLRRLYRPLSHHPDDGRAGPLCRPLDGRGSGARGYAGCSSPALASCRTPVVAP
jgi:peptidoglycan/LPS O-acetylase OafA/YrhL